MKGITMIGTSLALLLFSAVGYATPIKANYTVNANSTDPGLTVQTAGVADNPFSFNLAEGDSYTFDLFDIWTNENSVKKGEDTVPKPISVDFGFILPDVFTGSVDGTTSGYREVFGFFQGGELTWNGPGDFYFGPKSDGHLHVTLSDEIFNDGIVWGTHEGEKWGATVQATVTLVQDATAAVPEPGTLALFGIGLLGFAVTARRARRRA